MQPLPATSLIVLLTAVFSSAMQTRSMDPMLPVIATDLSVSLREAFVLSSAYAMPMALMQVVLGPTADALGKVRVIRTCLAIMAVGTTITVFANSYGLLLAARLLTGAAAGGVIPMTMALMADKVPPAGRQAAFGHVMTASTAAQVIGAAMAGVSAGTLGWRPFYAILAVVSIAALVGARATLAPDIASPRKLSLSRALSDYGRIITTRGSKLIALLGVINGVTVVGMFALVAPLLQGRGGDGPFQAGIAVAGFACGGFALGIAMRWLAGRLPLARLMTGALALVGIAQIGVGLPLPWPVTALLYTLVGFGFFALQNSLLALSADLVPDARGSAVAILLFSVFNGQSLGPIVWGAVAAQEGYDFCFRASGMILLSLSLITIRALKQAGLPRSPG